MQLYASMSEHLLTINGETASLRGKVISSIAAPHALCHQGVVGSCWWRAQARSRWCCQVSCASSGELLHHVCQPRAE